MAARPTIVRGTNNKPAASDALADYFATVDGFDGQVFIGYPIIGTASGRYAIDAVFVSPQHGVIVFDLVDGRSVSEHENRQDDAATKLESRLLTHGELVRKRQLRIPIHTLTYAPALPTRSVHDDDEYPVANGETLSSVLASFDWNDSDFDIFERTLSAIQSISTIRRPRGTRVLKKADSRGAKLQRLEDSIATLDNLQSKAVIETVEGVQRIRGLAGSGKTIVLALKAAYLHAQHPEWRIAVTFNTRSLKGHFTRLINNFAIEQTGEEPNWDQIRIINAWGAPGSASRDGIYHEFCAAHGIEYMDFQSATAQYGRDTGFAGVCAAALATVQEPKTLYDVILVDEAQDFPPEFLRLCYSILDEHKRLVYAYDELQNLSGTGLPTAEELFGSDDQGTPLVTFDQLAGSSAARRDIILEKCYRNSRPVLVTAHGLGFGVSRPPPRAKKTGLVQMFDQPELWTDIGYHLKSGKLASGKSVVLERTPETSPMFLEAHSPIEDLIHFQSFDNERNQASWVATQIARNLKAEELRHDDIVVINTDPVTTRRRLGPVRKALLDRGISSHIAGVDTVADVFFRSDDDSVTCTGIFRAKGNEAAMVYVINAQECHSDSGNLARVRNRLFTAITRSKSWVRVVGIGPAMQAIEAEYEAIRAASFELRFKYPTAKELAELQIVHRDMSAAEEKVVRTRKEAAAGLLADLESGRLYPEDLDADVLERLRDVLAGGGQ